ncbi:MAG: hypothetical protein AB1468_04335 [Candidatus Micrarchaeota archaeon]
MRIDITNATQSEVNAMMERLQKMHLSASIKRTGEKLVLVAEEILQPPAEGAIALLTDAGIEKVTYIGVNAH